jgi:hypothetical protein
VIAYVKCGVVLFRADFLQGLGQIGFTLGFFVGVVRHDLIVPFRCTLRSDKALTGGVGILSLGGSGFGGGVEIPYGGRIGFPGPLEKFRTLDQ